MKLYYYIENDKEYGPFSFDDLKTKAIFSSTLIWYDGLADWTTADRLDELKNYIRKTPPPIPKRKIVVPDEKGKSLPRLDKYDQTYTNEKFLLYGIMYALVLIIVSLIIRAPSSSVTFDTITYIMMAFNIIFSIQVYSSCKERDRNSIGWTIFTLLVGWLPLILLGSIKKKLIPENFVTKTDQEKSIFFQKYAYRLAKVKSYENAKYYVRLAIDLDNENSSAFDTNAYIKFFLNEYSPALDEANKAIALNDKNSEYFFHRGHIKLKLEDKNGAFADWHKAGEMGNMKAFESLKNHNYQFVQKPS